MTLTTTEELKHLASSDNTNELTRRLARECLANREAQPVVWGAPKTVGQMIGQLQTLDPEMETTALLRMPADFRDGNAVRQVPISISFERLDGMWLAPYKGEGRKVLAFWAKADHREADDRGELLTAPPAPAALPVQHYEELCRQHPNMSIGDAIIRAAWWNHCCAELLKSGTPPAPAVPPEATPENIENLLADITLFFTAGSLSHGGSVMFAEVWNACRAAMLAQSVTGGWIACGERMPDETQPVIVVSGEGVVQRTVYQFCDGTWSDWYDQHDHFNADVFTHWMPLPAAPEGGNG
ncbi:hypothetical protein SMQE31_05560 [Serratia marcescens]|nr:hypothetical protein SMQE31_05560 [Serratia marcescens]